MFYFYSPWKRVGFPAFSGDIDIDDWSKLVWVFPLKIGLGIKIQNKDL